MYVVKYMKMNLTFLLFKMWLLENVNLVYSMWLALYFYGTALVHGRKSCHCGLIHSVNPRFLSICYAQGSVSDAFLKNPSGGDPWSLRLQHLYGTRSQDEAAALYPNCVHSANWPERLHRRGLLCQVPRRQLTPSARGQREDGEAERS